MKRALIATLVVVAASCVGAGCQRPGNEEKQALDNAEILPTGDFLSDSLGVGLALPNSPGWSFRHDPPLRGGSYVTAHHEGETASVRLFVTPASDVGDLESLIQRRRDQLAGLFGVSDLGQVIERVIREEQQEVDGFPAMQWQAVTEPVGVAGEDPSRVIFMWIVTLRAEYAYECVGLARVPVEPSNELRAASEGLINDMAFILQSLQIR